MLLNEWFAWYEAMPSLEAQEQEMYVYTAMLADAGWDYKDRQGEMRRLRERAMGGEPPQLLPSGQPVSDEPLVDQTRRVFAWLRAAYGGGVSYG